MCRAVVLIINPIVFWSCCCRHCRGCLSSLMTAAKTQSLIQWGGTGKSMNLIFWWGWRGVGVKVAAKTVSPKSRLQNPRIGRFAECGRVHSHVLMLSLVPFSVWNNGHERRNDEWCHWWCHWWRGGWWRKVSLRNFSMGDCTWTCFWETAHLPLP